MEYDCGGDLDGICGCGVREMGYVVCCDGVCDGSDDFCGGDVGGEFVLDFAWVDWD